MRVLLVDNYDSFTYNVVAMLVQLGADVQVVPNDAGSLSETTAPSFDAIIISPGPGGPESAGISCSLVSAAIDLNIPLLGICLGMQCIAQVCGSRVIPLDKGMVHGKASAIIHDGQGVYTDMKQRFLAGRYHSLVVGEQTLSKDLVASAHTEDGVLMGIRHRSAPVEGVQFHPESVLTPNGMDIVSRFLEVAC